MELMITLIIIGILAAIAFPHFRASRELAWQREAQTNLKLIHAAEKIYGVANSVYYQYGTTSDINSGLHLDIPLTNNWVYSVDSATATNFRAKAVRGGKTWCIQRAEVEPVSDASCN